MHAFDRVEDGLVRHRNSGCPPKHRAEGLDQAPLEWEHPVHVPAERLGKGEQPKGLARRCAVDHDKVPPPRADLVTNLEEREYLVSAWQDRELRGLDRIDARGVEDRE